MITRFGDCQVDSSRRTLVRHGAEVHLTPKAFDLLVLLLDKTPRVVRKNELHQQLWPGTFVSDATLVGLVKEVRRALDDRDSSAPIIRTVHRVGYAFAAPIERAGSTSSSVSRWIVAGSRRIALRDQESIIGRDPGSAIHLDAPGVSRHHARIVIEGGEAWLEDLGSKNGTIVRGEEAIGRVALRDEDEIRLGPVSILYRASTSGVSTETTVRASRRRKPDRTA